MSHNVDTMAYSGECPWHGLGNAVSNDLTPEEMMIASGTNWNVSLEPEFLVIKGVKVATGNNGLYREDKEPSEAYLDSVGGDNWQVTQNAEAFGFFKEFVEAGDMEMSTAGSLDNGRIVWVLAKIKNEFDLFGGDVIKGNVLLTNYHKYGFSRDVRVTPVRVVCNNTLTMALNGKANKVLKASHRVALTQEMINDTLGLIDHQMAVYEEQATFLGSKRYDEVAIQDFFMNVFPKVSTIKTEKPELSKNARHCVNALEHQPGVKFAAGSWWQALNAVTYVTDHMMGRSQEGRVENMWYGQVKDLKLRAVKLALDAATKA